METQHIFKSGDTAHTIWGEKVILEDRPLNVYSPLGFWSEKYHDQLSVTSDGCFMIDKNIDKSLYIKILYPHPIRVTPIPEFEEWERIQVSDDERDWNIAYFIHRLKSGQFIASKQESVGKLDLPTVDSYYFARKITKPEKTADQIKDELIEKLQEKISLIEAKEQIAKEYGYADFIQADNNEDPATISHMLYLAATLVLSSKDKEIAELKENLSEANNSLKYASEDAMEYKDKITHLKEMWKQCSDREIRITDILRSEIKTLEYELSQLKEQVDELIKEKEEGK